MKSTAKCIRELIRMAAPLWGRILLGCIPGIVHIAASLTFVWAGKELVDIVTGESSQDLRTALLIFVACAIAMLIAFTGDSWWKEYFNVTTRNSMRLERFSHVLRSRWIGKEHFHSADTVNRLEEDIRVIAELLCTKVPDVIVTTLKLLAACTFLFIMQPDLLWMLLIIMPVAIIGSRLFFIAIRKVTSRIRSLDSDVQRLMQESLVNRLVIRTLGHTDNTVAQMEALQDDIRTSSIKRLNYNATSRAFMILGFRAGYIAAFLWGIFGIRDGVVTYGMMTAFLQLVGQVQGPIANLSQHFPAFIHALTSVERLMEIDELEESSQKNGRLIEGAPGIRVENLTFSYDDSPREIISNFSCDIKPGSICAIMGETGAGKSTLTRIMMGLLSPKSGKVSLYNNDTAAESGEDTLCNFMYVPQGNSLLSGSIRENLLIAKPDAGEDEMKDALHTAVADFVFSLPEGLDTVCSEKGSGLSEGQAQRIAIARALLKTGGILVLDEATSALDPDTEKKLLENLYGRYAGKKTVVWITHRESVASTLNPMIIHI